jgi:hypothetical protein
MRQTNTSSHIAHIWKHMPSISVTCRRGFVAGLGAASVRALAQGTSGASGSDSTSDYLLPPGLIHLNTASLAATPTVVLDRTLQALYDGGNEHRGPGHSLDCGRSRAHDKSGARWWQHVLGVSGTTTRRGRRQARHCAGRARQRRDRATIRRSDHAEDARDQREPHHFLHRSAHADCGDQRPGKTARHSLRRRWCSGWRRDAGRRQGARLPRVCNERTQVAHGSEGHGPALCQSRCK